MARLFERCPDSPDATVHHVRGRDNVHAGRRLHQRLLHQNVERLVVEDVARVVDYAILAVRGIRIERHVGHDSQLGKTFF